MAILKDILDYSENFIKKYTIIYQNIRRKDEQDRIFNLTCFLFN